jgi:hypothetical protein
MDRVIQVTLAIPHASKSLGGENSPLCQIIATVKNAFEAEWARQLRC